MSPWALGSWNCYFMRPSNQLIKFMIKKVKTIVNFSPIFVHKILN